MVTEQSDPKDHSPTNISSDDTSQTIAGSLEEVKDRINTILTAFEKKMQAKKPANK
jgi:hypothetical protein